jgi:hypothetical protein
MTMPALTRRLARWAVDLLDLGSAHARSNAAATAATITAKRAEHDRAASLSSCPTPDIQPLHHPVPEPGHTD